MRLPRQFTNNGFIAPKTVGFTPHLWKISPLKPFFFIKRLVFTKSNFWENRYGFGASGNEKRNLPKVSGFTLVEIIIATAIIVVLMGLALIAGMDFYKTFAFGAERNLAVSALMKARNHSMANLNQSKHGIRIDSGRYIVFQGQNFVSRNPAYDENIDSNSVIVKSGIAEIIFEQLTGNPNATGTFTLSDGKRTADITIENEGRINW